MCRQLVSQLKYKKHPVLLSGMVEINDHDFKDMPEAYWQYKFSKERNLLVPRELNLIKDSLPLKKIEYSLEKKKIIRCRCDLDLEKERTRQFELALETEREKTVHEREKTAQEKAKAKQLQEQTRNLELQIELEKLRLECIDLTKSGAIDI